MKISRRRALQSLMTGSAVTASGATGLTALTGVAKAQEPSTAVEETVGMLYDATRCVGCQSCVVACAEANKLQPDVRVDSLHYTARDLNSFTKNIIKLYRPAGAAEWSYVKQQCMHCVDPSCAAGCPFKALHKDAKTGAVLWDSKKCIGCRYCEISCPYHVPKFQWEGANPKIVKCELCKDRLAQGLQPACTSVCPVHAVTFGTRKELLAEAANRIKENPGRYYENRIYGESEGGGTQVLYLSHVPFEKLGLPKLDSESVPHKYLKWQERLYSYLVFPVAAYACIAGVVRKNWKDHEKEAAEEETRTGLRAQL